MNSSFRTIVLTRQHIARANPADVRLLNSSAFFTPHFSRNADVFESTKIDFDAHRGYTRVSGLDAGCSLRL